MFSSKNQKTSRLPGAAVPPLRPCATTETCYPKPDVVAWRYPWDPMGMLNNVESPHWLGKMLSVPWETWTWTRLIKSKLFTDF